MKKTTVYLPDELKTQLEGVARSERRSEAEVILDAIASAVAGSRWPEPRIPLPGVSLGDPSVAERAGDLMEGAADR